MERLVDLMNKKGYLKKHQADILKLFKHITDNQKERTICIFMEFVESSDWWHDAVKKCTSYVYELYGGTQVRSEILGIFHERDYDISKRSKVFNLFGDIPFEEKENLAKEIYPIVFENQDFNLILSKVEHIVSEFKKAKNIN